MKKAFRWSVALLAVAAVACTDDMPVPEGGTGAEYSDGDVVFTFPNTDSRTTYAEPWAETGNQDIFWGNYIERQEQIKVYCRESHGNVAVYNVNPDTSSGSSTAISVGKADSNEAIRWGAQYTDRNYEFYAFYPAASASGFIGDTGHTIQASVESGQVPRLYKYQIGNGELKAMTLDEIANQGGIGADKVATIFAMPDMESAIMTAHTSVAGVPNDANKTGYGYPVPLDFNVIADVLDFTINGPVYPNSLGGNSVDDKRMIIKIRSLTIQSKNKEALAGSFSMDLETGKVTPINGDNRINVSTADNGQYPTLHVRTEQESDTKTIDKMRVRVFLMPGQITNLNQLSVTVVTDCGDYSVDLGDQQMVSGAIHQVKLNYFKQRGAVFDFKQWIGQLDPNIYLSELSIPGTWHSSNSNNQGDEATETANTAGLIKQYNAGIRAFEVHTTNGTEPKKFGDFDTELKNVPESELTYETKPYSSYTKIEVKSATQTGAISEGQITEQPVQGTSTTQTATQDITADFNVELQKTVTSNYLAKFSLRLYRSRNVSGNENPTASFSDALMQLADVMNPTGFMFFEFGMEGERTVGDIPARISTEVAAGNGTVERKGTRTRTRTRSWSVIGGWTWSEWSEWSDPKWDDEVSEDAVTDIAWEAPATTTSTAKVSIDGGAAWAIAIESCLNRLATKTNQKTGKTYLHTTPVTANTTIKDVQGQVIAKINTNSTNNERYGWSGNTPALFSRWDGNSAYAPQTVNLKWGEPVAPEPLLTGSSDLHWCFSELENVPSANLQDRIKALTAFSELSYKNYSEGLHRTFYECAIGGYLGSNTAPNCQELAKKLNPALLNVLTNPSLKACPFGIVFMNYAIPPTGEEDAYKSADLIRTIINNNSAFTLQRAGGASSQMDVNDHTNSSFTPSTGGNSFE